MIETNLSTGKRENLVAAIGEAVMRWQDATQAYDEAVGGRLELNVAEQRTLSFLFAGPQPAGAIAEAVSLTPAAVTALIDRLEARGYLKRERSAEDRRKVMVDVTDKAREATGRYYMPLAAAGERFMRAFTDEQLEFALVFMKGAIEIQQKALADLAEGRL
jgi:DNA-binding MarR family transcriptional regulator